MPIKKGAGGRMQNYDSHGRYARTSYFSFSAGKMSRKETVMRREDNRRQVLYNRAKKKNDPMVLDVFLAIENAVPGEVQAVNDMIIDDVHMKSREVDIITNRFIIEVKSGKARHSLTQFVEQKELAEHKKRKYIVFAPNIAAGAENSLNEKRIPVIKNFAELVKIVKENKK